MPLLLAAIAAYAAATPLYAAFSIYRVTPALPRLMPLRYAADFATACFIFFFSMYFFIRRFTPAAAVTTYRLRSAITPPFAIDNIDAATIR